MSVYQKIDVLTGLTMLKDLAIGHPNKLKQDYGICSRFPTGTLKSCGT